jgi:hypothetical protein
LKHGLLSAGAKSSARKCTKNDEDMEKCSACDPLGLFGRCRYRLRRGGRP